MTTPDGDPLPGRQDEGEPPARRDEPSNGSDSSAVRRLGTSTFTIEGRRAPALFVVGWLATIMGAGFVLVAVLSGGGFAWLGLLLLGLGLLSVGLIAAAGSQGIERRARGVEGYAGPSPLLVFVASIPVSLLAVLVIGLPLGVVGFTFEGPAAAVLSVAIQAVVYVGLIRLLVVDTGALTWAEMGIRRLNPAAMREIVAGAAWGLPVVFATVPVALVLLMLFPVTPESPLPPTGEIVGFALSLLAGAVLAPFGEEVLFRGFATTAWVRGVGIWQGVIRAALVFALAHVLTTSGTDAGDAFGLAVVGFGTRVPIAIALGWLFMRRRNIWASFGLHAAFNAILLVISETANRSI